MNKKQWFASTDPQPMLQYLKGRASDRKLRLFAVACCRRFEATITDDPVSWQAVEVAERFADGHTTVKQCRLARASVEVFWGFGTDPVLRAIRETARAATKSSAISAALDASREVLRLAGSVVRSVQRDSQSAHEVAAAERCAIQAERQWQLAALRRHFSYPLHLGAVDPAWLTSDVLLLAVGIYEAKAFDRMPILADALQDAGCTNDEVLNHLRHGTNHTRGCWVLDALLGK